MIPGGPLSPAPCTQGGGKLTGEDDIKGILRPGYYGDLAVLSDDFFTVPEQDIPHVESLPTLAGGRIVHAVGEFEGLDEERPRDQPAVELSRSLRRLPGHRQAQHLRRPPGRTPRPGRRRIRAAPPVARPARIQPRRAHRDLRHPLRPLIPGLQPLTVSRRREHTCPPTRSAFPPSPVTRNPSL
ncbi:amidohydrolase family protein [Streptomyces sp. NPDC001970]